MKKMELEEKRSTLSDKEKEPFEKKKRDHLARQGAMKECITDALQKIREAIACVHMRVWQR
jgi:hypothetical protein